MQKLPERSGDFLLGEGASAAVREQVGSAESRPGCIRRLNWRQAGGGRSSCRVPHITFAAGIPKLTGPSSTPRSEKPNSLTSGNTPESGCDQGELHARGCMQFYAEYRCFGAFPRNPRGMGWARRSDRQRGALLLHPPRHVADQEPGGGGKAVLGRSAYRE